MSLFLCIVVLELWTSCNECLTGCVGCVLVEVLDETSGKVLSLLFPSLRICVSVARIEDSWVYVWQSCWYFEVEEWNLLGLSLED